MALTGFDPSVVIASINSVKGAYETLIGILTDDMQNQFVVGMSDKWACNNAQSFFNDVFKPAIDSLVSNTNVIFESVVTSMNGAGQQWAMETNSAYNPQNFSAIIKSIDTSIIKENIGGVRGIDLATATSVASKLVNIGESAKLALTSAQSAVENCGFIGGSQASNLVSSLGKIKTNIDSSIQEVTTQAKLAIETTVTDYSNTEGKIASAFAGN